MAASRFEKYRVKYLDNLGEAAFWNTRFRDIDTRLVDVENQKATLDAVIEEGRTVFRARVTDVLVPLVAEVQSVADLGALLRTHSPTEVEISTGGKTLVVDEADRLRFAAPGYLTMMVVGDPSRAMSGALVSYDKTTGDLVVDVDRVLGSGSAADWTITVANTTDAADDAAAAQAARDATLGYRTQAEGFALFTSADAATTTLKAAQAVAANDAAQVAKTTAQTQAAAAASAAASAVGYLNSFLGTHTTAPTTRANGSALQGGDWYFRTIVGPPLRYYIDYWDGAGWRSLTAASDTSVSSWAGRTGGIVPTAGDYTATQVFRAAGGGVAATTVEAALLEIRTAIDAAVATIDGGTFG